MHFESFYQTLQFSSFTVDMFRMTLCSHVEISSSTAWVAIIRARHDKRKCARYGGHVVHMKGELASIYVPRENG